MLLLLQLFAITDAFPPALSRYLLHLQKVFAAAYRCCCRIPGLPVRKPPDRHIPRVPSAGL